MIPFNVTFRNVGETQDTVLTAGIHFRFDIHLIEEFFSKALLPLHVDLLRIGMAAYLVDRLTRRKTRNQQYRWPRALALKVGVLEPGSWNTGETRDSLTKCLEFLTGDSWDITFERDDRRVLKKWQRHLFPFTRETQLCLYSGGLDSAAGLGNRVLIDPSRPTIPVTVWHQGGQRAIVRRQINLIREHCSRSDLNPLIFKAHLLRGATTNRTQEKTQRSRAFLFMAAGAVAASMCRCAEIEVYESGIGAMNLPLMAGMTGSRTTRSTHPEFLRRMSRLVSIVGNHEMAFTLPFFDRTKGDVIAELVHRGLGELPRITVSCVHFPLRVKSGKQCGICAACLFRRQAMVTAGIDEAVGTYRYDLFTGHGDLTRIPARKLDCLKAYLMQVRELQDIHQGKKLPDRLLRHLFGTSILRKQDPVDPAIRLLGRYRDQWMGAVRHAESKGYSWTQMIGPVGSNNEGMSRASA